MTETLRILGIAGSLRSASYSRALLDSMAAMLPASVAFETLDIGDFPHYDEDLERTALPAVVSAGRAQVKACDAVIIVTPEFNHGVPGVLKNALDWLSRPAFKSCFEGKPVMFATQATGALGGVRAQYQLRETLSSMLARVVPLPEIAVTHSASKLVEGRLVDEVTRNYIDSIVKRFLVAVSQA